MNVMMTVTSVTGPVNCFSTLYSLHIGITHPVRVFVTRGATSVSFYWGNISDDVSYSGTVTGDDFTAATGAMLSQSCTDLNALPLHGTTVATVTGRFSADGKHLDATDVWSFHFPWGDETVSYTWHGDQQP
jgi:hypothetical protein